MRRVKWVFLLILLFANLLTQAQMGCIGGSIPFQPSGAMFTGYNSGGYYELYGAKTVNPYALFCIEPTGGNCTIRGLASYPGIEVTFGPLPCPIDSHIYLLLIGITIYGVFRNKISRN